MYFHDRILSNVFWYSQFDTALLNILQKQNNTIQWWILSRSIINNSSMGLQSDLLKSSMYIDIDTVRKDWLPAERPRMHKVSLYLQVKKNEEPSVYEPISVSLGPYHHGK